MFVITVTDADCRNFLSDMKIVISNSSLFGYYGEFILERLMVHFSLC